MVLRKSHVRGGVCYFCGVIRNGLLFLLMFIAYGYKMDYHAIVEMCVLHFKRFERFLAERGRGMRKVDLIVVHCSATPPGGVALAAGPGKGAPPQGIRRVRLSLLCAQGRPDLLDASGGAAGCTCQGFQRYEHRGVLRRGTGCRRKAGGYAHTAAAPFAEGAGAGVAAGFPGMPGDGTP